MSIQEHVNAVREKMAAAAKAAGRDPGEITLCAATKVQTDDTIREAIAAGITVCGENRVQELTAHLEANAYEGAQVHFIGHLQTNKVRQLLASRRVALIESVDSLRLLQAIDAESKRLGIISRVLLQVHVAREETKFGFSPEEFAEFFRAGVFRSLEATHICGIMGMASNTDDTARVAADFRQIADCRRQALDLAPDLRGFDIVSMGMSGDYPLAIAEGSTLVRIGTAIFGPREY